MNATHFSISSTLQAGGRIWPGAVLGLACLLAVLTGCSPSLPQPADAEQAARTKITAESNGRIKLVQFKTATPQPEDESAPYRWRYEAQIEFTEDCLWHVDRVRKLIHVNFRTAPATNDQVAGQSVKKGDRWQVSGNLAIEKAKEGWESRSISLVKHKPAP